MSIEAFVDALVHLPTAHSKSYYESVVQEAGLKPSGQSTVSEIGFNYAHTFQTANTQPLQRQYHSTSSTSNCRLCGKRVPKRKRQEWSNLRQHLKHRCPHGRDCPSGFKGILSQTLTPRCLDCRLTLAEQREPRP